MSLTNDTGKNISQAIQVVRKTYENLDLLFTEMDYQAEKSGFVSLPPRFLRWKSDADYNGWLVNDFIKLYQLKDAPSFNNEMGLANSDIFAVEVNFEEEYPKLWLLRFRFDLSLWTRMPAVSDHWLFYYPFAEEGGFRLMEDNGVWTSTPPDEKARKKYWGIEKAVGRSMPMVQVSSLESIRTEIFGQLMNLQL